MLTTLLALTLATYSGASLRTGGGADGVEVPFTPAFPYIVGMQLYGTLPSNTFMRAGTRAAAMRGGPPPAAKP